MAADALPTGPGPKKIHDQIMATRGPDSRGKGLKLYPYQVEGTAFLAGTGRALLADDMGTGQNPSGHCRRSLASEPMKKIRKNADYMPGIPETAMGPGNRQVHRPGHPDHPGDRLKERNAQYQKGRRLFSFISTTKLILRGSHRDHRYPGAGSGHHGRGPEDQELAHQDRPIGRKNNSMPLRIRPDRPPPWKNRLEDLYSLMQVVGPQSAGSPVAVYGRFSTSPTPGVRYWDIGTWPLLRRRHGPGHASPGPAPGTGTSLPRTHHPASGRHHDPGQQVDLHDCGPMKHGRAPWPTSPKSAL